MTKTCINCACPKCAARFMNVPCSFWIAKPVKEFPSKEIKDICDGCFWKEVVIDKDVKLKQPTPHVHLADGERQDVWNYSNENGKWRVNGVNCYQSHDNPNCYHEERRKVDAEIGICNRATPERVFKNDSDYQRWKLDRRNRKPRIHIDPHCEDAIRNFKPIEFPKQDVLFYRDAGKKVCNPVYKDERIKQRRDREG